MKNLLILFLCGLASLAGAQTNAIKISALPAAAAMTGSELVPLNQSGSTKVATVNQLNAAPIALINATTNGLAAQLAAANAKINTASNYLWSLTAGWQDGNQQNWYFQGLTNTYFSGLFVSQAANLTTASNTLAGRIGTTSNTLAAAAASAQTTANAALLAAQGVPTNNGSATFASATIASLIQPMTTAADLITTTASTNILLPLNISGLVKLNVSTTGNGNAIYFMPTNISSGLSVTYLIRNVSSANTENLWYAMPGGAWHSVGGSYYPATYAGHAKTFSFQSMDTNIYCTVSDLQ